jgi:hypothetical protein
VIPPRARGDGPALHCAVGTIRYSAVDGTDPRDDGVLLYVKAGAARPHGRRAAAGGRC